MSGSRVVELELRMEGNKASIKHVAPPASIPSDGPKGKELQHIERPKVKRRHAAGKKTGVTVVGKFDASVTPTDFDE